jgi:predicted Fe-Mo cluster-binding NifX family protein
MRVAIAVTGSEVAEHFGRCDCFMLVTIEEKEIKSRDVLNTPPHEPGLLPRLLADQGVEYLIAGGIGNRAAQFMAQFGIEVLGGVQGSAENALSMFLSRTLEAGGGTCAGGKGNCGHEH